MLNPIRVRQSIVIRAKPHTVWTLFEHPERTLGLLPKGSGIELLTDRFDVVGSKWRTVTTQGGRRMEALNEVIEVEKPIRQVIRATSAVMTGESVTTLTPTANGTLMVIEGTATFPAGMRSLLNRIMTAIIGPIATRRALRHMKRLIELGEPESDG